jgi:hypothetical protein
MPIALFGRDNELDLIRSVIQSASTNFSGRYSASKGYNELATRSTNSSPEDRSQSSHSQASKTTAHDNSVSMSLSPLLGSSDSIRKNLLPHRSRTTRTQAVFVVGPPGYSATSQIGSI